METRRSSGCVPNVVELEVARFNVAAKKKARQVTDTELGLRKKVGGIIAGVEKAFGAVDISEEELDEIIRQEARKADAVRRYLPSILQTSRKRKRPRRGDN
jgi:hypothetical protein